jgi:histone deacetylase complex subunit SAP30
MNGGIDSSDENEKMENDYEFCCLIDDGTKCTRLAGLASFSKRIQKGISQRKMKLSLDSFARSQFICDYHKLKIQSARSMKRHQRANVSRDSDSGSDSESVEVDFYSLQVQTLRRYKKFYKVSTRPGLNKAQLADIISKHFMTIPVKEKEVLAYFIYSVKQSGQNQNNTKGLD